MKNDLPRPGMIWVAYGKFDSLNHRYIVLNVHSHPDGTTSFDLFHESGSAFVHDHRVQIERLDVIFIEPTEREQLIFTMATLNPDGVDDFVKGLNDDQRN
jgi:Zn-dependent peptidase ImmA (M78 family)